MYTTKFVLKVENKSEFIKKHMITLYKEYGYGLVPIERVMDYVHLSMKGE